MKRHIAIYILLFSLAAPSSGDVIFPSYASDKFTAAATIQKTFSYEKRIGKSLSIQPRTSVAILWPFYQKHLSGPAIPAGGVEIALESRWYLFTVDLSKFFYRVLRRWCTHISFICHVKHLHRVKGGI